MDKKKYIAIDGMDSSGKKTIITSLKSQFGDKIDILPSSELLRKQIHLHWDNWEIELLNNDKEVIRIFLEADPDVCIEKRKSTVERKELFYQRYKYRQFAGYYGNIHLIDTSLHDPQTIFQIVISIIYENNKEYYIPKVDMLSEKDVADLETVINSDSKIVRKINSNYHLVEHKPNVYSFTKKGVNVIPETDIERTKMTKEILEIISRNEVPHTYIYVGKKYIVNKSLFNNIDIPPVETIVKKYLIGSDKHNYYQIQKFKNRFGHNIIKNESNEYNKLMVRFDYRNPEFNPETKKVLGDFTMCDDLADEFLNVSEAKKLVSKCYTVLEEHFKKMGLILYDICFMVIVSGKEIYAEISQDCARIRPINCETDEKLKEIWCSGGSKEEYVLVRYKYFTEKCQEYVKKYLFSE